MRIALVTYALQIGGIETFLRLLAYYFQGNGHDVTFIETLARGRWSELFSQKGYRIIQILPSPFHSTYGHVKRIANELKQYDLIILNDAPHAQSVLGFLGERTVAIPVLHMYLKSMLSNATANNINWDVISAVSPIVQGRAIQYGVEKNRVFCIPNGIDVPDRWPKSDFEFDYSKRLNVTYVGAINHAQKGVFYLPGIFKKALGRNTDIALEITGDGPDLKNLCEMLSSNMINRNAVFHGSLPNHKAKEILGKSDVLIMPSHFEGLPLVLLEAMSLGIVPVVSRLTGCTDFVIEDGMNGILVEIGDENGFANALVRLSNDRSLLKSMSKRAWETIRARFSYTKTGASYLELFEKCKEQRQRGERPPRSREIDKVLLGDLPFLPILFVRPVRKILRMLRLFPKPQIEPLLYIPASK
jgi:glycosyltransferase involved in cell wall biosynthesis